VLCTAQGLDPVGSRTLILNVSMRITTYNINRVHNTLLHETVRICLVYAGHNSYNALNEYYI
jgi:hypothetical protein